MQDDREKDLFEEMDDEDEEDPRLEAIMGFVAEKLSTFDERIEAVEGEVRDVRRQLQENEQQQQQQQSLLCIATFRHPRARPSRYPLPRSATGPAPCQDQKKDIEG